MKHLKLFESFNKFSFDSLDEMEIENQLLEFSDKDDLRFYNYEKSDSYRFPSNMMYVGDRIYDLYGDKFTQKPVSSSTFLNKPCITFMIDIPHPGRIRGNLYLEGFTRDVINRYLEKIHKFYDVKIYYQILETNYLEDWISKTRIFIISNQPINESNDELNDYIESFFLELADHKDDFYPITVNIWKRVVGKNKDDGYQVQVDFDMYDKGFMEKKIELIKKRLKPEFQIRSSSVDESGIYRAKQISVHGADRTTTVHDPIYRWSICVSPKIERVSESTQNESTLLIVDVQKSFKKWFTEKYVSELKKYASQFTNVYQIWDNHVDGKNVDKDYLYDHNPKVPIHSDLYTFPNQKELIEKRYNYDVDADFYKKVLDKETLNKIKSTKLQRGNYFRTTEGTIIVYIGNNHQWYHVPKKLYNLLIKLRGKEVIIVGGSSEECLLDIITSCESLGVLIKPNYKYIYSASHCPIR